MVDLHEQWPPAQLTIDLHPEGDGAVRLAVAGEIDLSSVDLLERALATVDSAATTLIIDLAGVSFLDSSGVAALVGRSRHAAANGKRLIVINAHGAALRALDLTGVLAALSDEASAG